MSRRRRSWASEQIRLAASTLQAMQRRSSRTAKLKAENTRSRSRSMAALEARAPTARDRRRR